MYLKWLFKDSGDFSRFAQPASKTLKAELLFTTLISSSPITLTPPILAASSNNLKKSQTPTNYKKR